ncbi:MAG: hypothetical protein RBQ64_04225 [Candidatus Izemoplasmatales bacterium]|jgi:hypothetical protein|nr:hypothetical protein [Candidatus Izemoplasmatales bacterium]
MKTKIIFIIVILTLFTLTSYSQPKNEFALTYGKSIGTATYSILRQGFLTGTGSTDLQNNNALGVRYFRPINEKGRTKLELGLNYSWGKLKIKPAYTGEPEVDTWYKDFNLISLPVYMNHSLGKYFFINYGLILDYQDAVENEYSGFGIGTGFGFGARYSTDRYTFFVNPKSEKHLFLSEKDGLLEFGILCGIAYTF